MKLSLLPRLLAKKRSAKRLGLGLGSGKGKTAGRGHKGQKARGKIPLGFEGGQLKLIKRLPFVRGVGFSGGSRIKPAIVSLEELNDFADGTVVDLKSLQDKGMVSSRDKEVKILANGDIKKRIIIRGLRVSVQASKKIREAQGEVEKD